MANDIFRVGKVSSIDYAAGLVRVAYHDKDDSVTAPLPMLCTEYNMPQVGDPVMVLHLSNGTEAGLVPGRYWSGRSYPASSGPSALNTSFAGAASGAPSIQAAVKPLFSFMRPFARPRLYSSTASAASMPMVARRRVLRFVCVFMAESLL